MVSTQKKQAILQKAQIFFSEKGFWDTHISEIAKAAAVAEGTIFYHYRTKEALFLEVLKDFKLRMIAEFDHYLEHSTFASGLDMVVGLANFYLEQADQLKESFLLLHRHHSYQLAKENPEHWGHIEDLYDYLTSAFEKAVRTGQQDGSIRPSPPAKTAILLFTLIDGVVRLETYNLHRVGTLSRELVESCRKMVQHSP